MNLIRNILELERGGILTAEEALEKIEKAIKEKPEIQEKVRKKVTKKEIEFIKKNAKKMSQRRIGEALGRSQSVINHYMKKNGNRKYKKFSISEDAYLLGGIGRLSNAEMGRHLGRSRYSVRKNKI